MMRGIKNEKKLTQVLILAAAFFGFFAQKASAADLTMFEFENIDVFSKLRYELVNMARLPYYQFIVGTKIKEEKSGISLFF